MPRLHYFVEGKSLGWRELPPVFYSGGLYQPGSVAYYCPYCGRPWAEFAVEGQQWHYLAVTCRRCFAKATPYEQIPGTLFNDGGWVRNPLWSTIFYEGDLPPEVVRWEFRALLEHYERNYHDGSCS